MPFCPSCGNSVDGRFCQKCGASVGAASEPAFGAAAPASGAPGAPPVSQAPVAAAGLSENAAGALCYLAGFITGIIFLVLTPYNQSPRVRFHAFQSIFFNIAWVATWIVATIFFMVIGMVMPFAFHILISLLGLAVWCGFLLVWLYLMWKASQGQSVSLPVIGPLAMRQAGS